MTTKLEMSAAGRERVTRFCLNNGVKPPPMCEGLPVCVGYGYGCGLYDRGTLYVETKACAHIGRGGMAWSYPGYVIDRTPFGVWAHELGHHWDFKVLKSGSARVRRKSGEPQLTNYAPNTAEWFAEMFRLFVTNPDLLRLCRPATYAALLAEGCRPVEDRAWNEVLAEAPARTLAMAEKKFRILD